jgi:hypothetical protein
VTTRDRLRGKEIFEQPDDDEHAEHNDELVVEYNIEKPCGKRRHGQFPIGSRVRRFDPIFPAIDANLTALPWQ